MPSFDNKLLKSPIIFNLRSVMEYRPKPSYALFPSYGLFYSSILKLPALQISLLYFTPEPQTAVSDNSMLHCWS